MKEDPVQQNNPAMAKEPASGAEPPGFVSSFSRDANPKGRRYTDAQRKKVVEFVNAHNAIHGRGGQSEAARKFNLSLLTVAAWLKKSRSIGGLMEAYPYGQDRSHSSDVLGRVAEFMEIDARLRRAEAEVSHLREKRESLADFIRRNL